mgnify:CR=1 FL=1
MNEQQWNLTWVPHHCCFFTQYVWAVMKLNVVSRCFFNTAEVINSHLPRCPTRYTAILMWKLVITLPMVSYCQCCNAVLSAFKCTVLQTGKLFWVHSSAISISTCDDVVALTFNRVANFNKQILLLTWVFAGKSPNPGTILQNTHLRSMFLSITSYMVGNGTWAFSTSTSTSCPYKHMALSSIIITLNLGPQ